MGRILQGASSDEKFVRSYSLWSLKGEECVEGWGNADTITPAKRVFKNDEIPLSSAITSASGAETVPVLSNCGVATRRQRRATNGIAWDCLDIVLDIVRNTKDVPGFITLLSDLSQVPFACPDRKGEPRSRDEISQYDVLATGSTVSFHLVLT